MVCFVYSCKSITIKREIIIAPLDIFMIMPGPKKIRSAHFCCALLIYGNNLLLYLHPISQLKLTASLRQGGHRNISYRDISPQGEAISQGETFQSDTISGMLRYTSSFKWKPLPIITSSMLSLVTAIGFKPI